ncbi:penicillin-binding transpeptidase domain-containing protein [Pseudomonas sp. PCH446]
MAGWTGHGDHAFQRHYFYDLAHKLGIDRLSTYMNKFGLGQKVSLDMFEESPGLMPSREWKRTTRRQAWFPGETLILGIGQGYMQATPLQLAQATALVANKGVWNRPHLAKTIEGQKPLDPDPMPDIVLRNPADWDKVSHGMQQVMHGARGTARKAAVGSQYLIAGKSGTARSWRSSRARSTTARKSRSVIATMPCSSASPRPRTRKSPWQ